MVRTALLWELTSGVEVQLLVAFWPPSTVPARTEDTERTSLGFLQEAEMKVYGR